MRKFNVTVNGKSYYVEVEELGANAHVAPVQRPIVEETVAPKATSQPQPVAPAGGTPVLAPMPGLILDLKVPAGTAVKKDQTVLVLEAMKMENEIVAPCDGVITFAVSKGSNVESGSVLATIA
ncbi:MAG: acetyl-CoA carboxylase biotin carboxyl carrier protein subunit [Clostridia bacterium]|nr:acetyl-CoA carboxylase biotin carboxyl carrier protein subunit [Clostridia bacterium]